MNGFKTSLLLAAPGVVLLAAIPYSVHSRTEKRAEKPDQIAAKIVIS